MSELERRRAIREGDVTLSSGLVVRIRRIPTRLLIRAGGIPLEAVNELQEKVAASNGNTPNLTDKQIRQAGEFNDAIVFGIIVAVDTEPITIADLELLSDEEYNELLAYALGSTPLPFVEAAT